MCPWPLEVKSKCDFWEDVSQTRRSTSFWSSFIHSFIHWRQRHIAAQAGLELVPILLPAPQPSGYWDYRPPCHVKFLHVFWLKSDKPKEEGILRVWDQGRRVINIVSDQTHWLIRQRFLTQGYRSRGWGWLQVIGLINAWTTEQINKMELKYQLSFNMLQSKIPTDWRDSNAKTRFIGYRPSLKMVSRLTRGPFAMVVRNIHAHRSSALVMLCGESSFLPRHHSELSMLWSGCPRSPWPTAELPCTL